MEPPRVASNYTLFCRKPWAGHSTLLRTRLWVVTQRYCIEKRLRQRLSGKHNWQHAVPQSTGHFRRPCEAISCDNVKAFSVRNSFVFYLSTMKSNKKKIQKSEVKISFKADELITANNERIPDQTVRRTCTLCYPIFRRTRPFFIRKSQVVAFGN